MEHVADAAKRPLLTANLPLSSGLINLPQLGYYAYMNPWLGCELKASGIASTLNHACCYYHVSHRFFKEKVGASRSMECFLRDLYQLVPHDTLHDRCRIANYISHIQDYTATAPAL